MLRLNGLLRSDCSTGNLADPAAHPCCPWFAAYSESGAGLRATRTYKVQFSLGWVPSNSHVLFLSVAQVGDFAGGLRGAATTRPNAGGAAVPAA